MSLNYIKELLPTSIIDSRIDLREEKNSDFGVIKGPKNNDYYELSPTSGETSSGGTTDFTYTLPSRQNVINRVIFLKGKVTYDISAPFAQFTQGTIAGSPPVTTQSTGQGTGLNDGAYLLNLNTWGPRSWPLSRMIQTLQLDFDGKQVSVNLDEWVDVQANYMYIEEELKTFSTTSPSLLDNTFLFGSGVSNSSPLGYFGNIGTGFVPTRSSFQLIGFTNTPASATPSNAVSKLVYNFCEPINISPLISKAIREYTNEGITGVSTIKIKITWKSPQEMFDKSFCLNILQDSAFTLNGENISTPSPKNSTIIAGGGAAATFPDDSITLNPSIFTRSAKVENLRTIISVLTLPDGSAIPPPINSYDYYRFEYHTKKQTLTAGPKVSTTVSSDNFNLMGVPHSMIVWGVVKTESGVVTNLLGRSPTATAPTPATGIPEFSLPNAYIPITKIEVKLGNQPYVLSEVSPSTLFLMNVNNGGRFKNFSSTGMDLQGGLQVSNMAGANASVILPIGSPLMLKFGKDIPLMDSTLAPGVSVNLQLNFRVSFANYTQQTMDIDMRCMFLYEGSFTVGLQGSSFVTTPLTRSDVVNAAEMGGEIDASELSPENFEGKALIAGSFIGKLKNFGKKTWKFFNKPEVKNILKESLDLASAMNIPGASQIEYAIDKGQDVAKALQGKGRGGMLLDARHQSGGNYMNSVGGNYMNSVGGATMTPAQLRARMRK